MWLTVKHPDFAQQIAFAATRRSLKLTPADATLPPLHPATFVQALELCKPVRGVVREHGAGRPVAGATVYSQMMPRTNSGVVKAATAADGTFDIRGLGKAESYVIVIVPAEGQPHLRRTARIPDTAGLEPIGLDIDLFRGVAVQGRITDKVTGRPIYGATLSYILLPGNPHSEDIAEAGDEAWDHRFTTDRDGSFTVTIPPGPGLIGVRSGYGGEGQFRALKKEDLPYSLEEGETLRTSFGRAVRPERYHALVKINPPEDGPIEALNIQLNPIEGK